MNARARQHLPSCIQFQCIQDASRLGFVKCYFCIPDSSLSSLPPYLLAALETLRQSVRSTNRSKPEFLTMHQMLSTCDMDLKKTLGAKMDVSTSLAR